MKRIPLLFIILLITVLAFSQEGYVNGYIITNKGDTIRGKIKDRKYYNNVNSWQKINFINNKGENEKLTAEELLGYVKNDTIVYHTLTLGIEGKKRFVSKIENGTVILFVDISGTIAPKEEGNSSPFGEKLFVYIGNGKSKQKITGDYYLQRKGDVNSLMEWRDRDYKRTAGYFFKDDTELMKVLNSDSLGFNDLQTLVRMYNEWKIKQ